MRKLYLPPTNPLRKSISVKSYLRGKVKVHKYLRRPRFRKSVAQIV